MNNTPEPVATDFTASRNIESGSKVAARPNRNSSEIKSEGWAGRWSNLASDHSKRWEKRLYMAKSGGVEVGKLAVRIQHLGERDEFRFDTTNRQKAASEAFTVFRFLKVNGWKATRAKFKPDGEGQPKLDVTVGDYLSAVEGTRKLRGRTFLNYRNCLRTIIAETFGIKPKKGENKFDYRAGGNAAWTKRIDEVHLERLTPEKVTNWKRDRIANAGHSPAAVASANRTVNSYIRCARSLFSLKPDKKGNPGILKELQNSTKLLLPQVLPFDGVGLFASGSQKYHSKINAQTLIAAARDELKFTDPEAYKVFLLGLFAGMRKAEIDTAEWQHLDFGRNTIRVEITDWLHLKSDASFAIVPLDAEVVAELRELMPVPTAKPAQWSQFIIQSPRRPRPESKRAYYRSQKIFKRMYAWLRRKGIRANKPVHELRKEVGAVLATEKGIFAAQNFLRHSDITTTARHYTDQKARINVGLGRFLDTAPKLVPDADKSTAA